QILKSETAEELLPSVVHYQQDGQRLVGTAAKSLFAQDPHNTIVSVKRLMGRNREDIQASGISLPLKWVDSQVLQIDTVAGALSPVEISADILKSLIARAKKVDKKIDEAVITVPAYFDEAQRQATKDAARLAGIKVLRLLNEPTAAAIAYGLDQGAQGYCLVYDMGGGTFDVSLLKLSQGVFEVLATGGDTHLGGDDIDSEIAKWMLAQAQLSIDAYPLALVAARKAKEQLTTESAVKVGLANWQGELSRTLLNEWIAPLIERTLMLCQQVLKDASLKISDINQVVLVGGSTRMPLLREKITTFFAKTPLTNIDPDRVVAIGAAIQASQLAGNRRDNSVLLLDVVPLSLGIEMMGGVVEKIVLRNTPIPAQAMQLFTTYQDNQTGLSLHVVQGERELADDCSSL
ncbi:MAG TPA: Hsp70 family protein, partial [Candidatus Berkiella sp.]|nr:Hsp70 family protein [Candidatus Berkiella sp.]